MRHGSIALALLVCACGPSLAPSGAEPVAVVSAAATAPEAPVCASEPSLPEIPPGPLFVSYVHPEGHWVGVCQAPATGGPPLLRFGHHGEAPADARPRILSSDGTTMEVERFVAVGPRGRWVLVHREGALALVDTETRASTRLRASHERDDPGSYVVGMDHPPASFDRLGHRLAYVRWAPDPMDTVAVVRDLATGEELVVPAPAHHRMVGARIDRDGAWLWVWSVREGLATRAFRRLGGGNRQCHGPARPDAPDDGLPARAGGGRERRAVALASVADGAQPVPWIEGAILGLGDTMLVREADHALAVVSAEGERSTVVPASCDAIGLHAGVGLGSFAVLCRSSDEVQLFAGAPPRLGVSYTFETPLRADEDQEWRSPRWIDSGGRRFDLEGRAQATVPAGAEVLAEHAGQVLYRTGDCELGVAGGDQHRSLGQAACSAVRSRAGAYVLLDEGAVVDVLSQRVGVLSGRGWAVHDSGAALVTSERHPLFWERVHFLERPCPCEAR